MKCSTCGKEQVGGIGITLAGNPYYYCSSLCARNSEHSDQVKIALIELFLVKYENTTDTQPKEIRTRDDLYTAVDAEGIIL